MCIRDRVSTQSTWERQFVEMGDCLCNHEQEETDIGELSKPYSRKIIKERMEPTNLEMDYDNFQLFLEQTSCIKSSLPEVNKVAKKLGQFSFHNHPPNSWQTLNDTISTNGGKYFGYWNENNERDGPGVMIWDNGSRFDGNWLYDRITGKGRLIHPNGDVYEGDWFEDEASGKGIYYQNDGLIYDCLLYTSPSPRDLSTSRMPSSA
eukprot:TRINITY_DN2583_c0_g1_i13.p1 TRINITY_DN2583_c0_g1~~TRINITY_DN2583_c0_g1_i13.p1  ORF type:complete len:206 (+),score=26.29 TRINITY_DN2583_c0_g1_i13:163-780(+)